MSLFVDIKKIYKGFSLDVKFECKDEAIGILGASGSGKSMTLRCIAGIDTPTEGRIVLHDKVLFDSKKGINLPVHKRKVGFLFQNFALFPHMTVMKNITFALEHLHKEERIRIAIKQLQEMQLEGLENRYPSELSGGQQQRVAMARALSTNPSILLLDEPFSALDNHLRHQMQNHLIKTLSSYKGTTLFVTHNIEEAYGVSNNLIIFDNGKIVAKGCKDEIFKSPPTLEAARITGCKNISRVSYNPDGTVEALDWGCRINLSSTLENKNISHIGIRAHYIQLANETDTENVFKCRILQVIEGPFEVIVYLEAIDVQIQSVPLQWMMVREMWHRIKNIDTYIKIKINKEKIFFLKNQRDSFCG